MDHQHNSSIGHLNKIHITTSALMDVKKNVFFLICLVLRGIPPYMGVYVVFHMLVFYPNG